MNLRYPALVIFFVFMVYGCANSPYPPDVKASLKAAGDNRAELEKVLDHYLAESDSLKLQAAYYLIGNMEGHCYATYRLIDTAGTEVEFNVLDYPDYDSLVIAANAIEDKRGELDYEKAEKILDLETITADFLIEQIDDAFEVWRGKPWARDLSYENFRDYVLPYRGSNEPLESWRAIFRERYADIDANMTDDADPMEAAALINEEIVSWFKFDPRFYYHPTDQGLSEMFENKLGRCEDMTNLTIYAMRANGLAVTSDYTPAWADCGNNHAWNAIVTPEGKVIPFMGAECNPGKYNLGHKFAKVYRKTFGAQKNNLVFLDKKQEKVPGWLAGRNYVDVTADYGDVCDVTIKFDREIPDSVDVAYLCVFNSGEWRAIHWSRIENGTATFTDMAMEIVYIPALYLNEEIVPYGAPFILESDGSRRQLEPNSDERITVAVASTTKRQLDRSTDGIAKSYLTPGQEYELFYMAGEWESLGKLEAGETTLEFSSAPSGALYWLVATDSDKEERIFTIEDGQQMWW